jgi:PAS domain S-box-containing protein
MDVFRSLFTTELFMPLGHCYLWRPDILWLHVLADAFMSLAYFGIPILLILLVRKRSDFRFNRLFILFALFITACGLSHLMNILTVWQPFHGMQGFIKAIAAMVSVTTLAALYVLMPKALSFPSIPQLEQAEQRYRTILHSAMDAFVAVDQEGRIRFCNKQLMLLTGWEEKELMGSLFIEKFVPSRLQTPEQSPWDFFLHLTRMNLLLRNGQEIPTDINTTVVEDDRDRMLGIFIHDASERLLAAALQTTQLEVTKTLVDSESIDEAFHRFIQITCTGMGWEFGGVWTGKRDDRTFHLQDIYKADDPVIQDFAAAYSRHQQPMLPLDATAPVQARRLPGSILPHHLQIRVDLDHDKVGIIEFLSSHPRATDKKILEVLEDLRIRLSLFVKRQQAEEKTRLSEQELKRQVAEQTEELRHSANQIRSITNALPDAIIYFDQKQHTVFANDTWLRWQNLASNEVHGRSVGAVFGVEIQEKMQRLFSAPCQEQISFDYEFRCGDARRLCQVICIPDISERSGRLRGVITVLADITDQRSYEENLRIAKEAADTANAAKSAFLANMSHEIRTPLGAILGYSELLASQGISASERLNYVSALKRNGELLSNIINDVLDLSKVEAGKLDFEKQQVPIEEILTDITTLLHLQAMEKGIGLLVSADGPIPATIQTDPLRLRQILMNIVGNALKFTERGSIEVKVKTVPGPEGKILLAFVVQDTGPGITPEQAQKLFKPFSQADVSTTRKFGGTGLGLTLSKKLAAGLGGDLELTASVPGHGSTFTITIDPGRTSQVLFRSSPQNLARPHASKTPADSLRIDGLRLLLVEDSPDNQIVVQRFLKMAGCEADLANHGREALDMIQAKDYDVVLMDIQMPIMDGFEAIAEIRRLGYRLPVVALTAHALKEQRQECLEKGFTHHITKPVNRDALITMLVQFLKTT